MEAVGHCLDAPWRSVTLAPPTGTQGSYSYPVHVFSQCYMYQDLEPSCSRYLAIRVPPQPRVSASPRYWGSCCRPRRPEREQGGRCCHEAAVAAWIYVPPRATGIDTNGYSVEEGSQATCGRGRGRGSSANVPSA